MSRYLLLLLAVFTWSTAKSDAAIVTLVAQNVGNYNNFGTNEQGFYTLGNVGGLEFRNFAIFDVSGLSGTVLSATLRTNSGDPVLRVDDIEVFMRSYSGSIPALTAGTANFADLGSGNDYGNLLIPGSFPDNSPLSIDLNATAVADINAASGLFAIAGSQPVPTATSGIFGENPADEVFLDVEVPTAIPEPGSWAIVFGIALLAFGSRRKSRSAAS